MNVYTKLARNTIEEYVKNNKIIKIPADLTDDLIKKRAGTFVSIHTKHGSTRKDGKTSLDSTRDQQIDAEGELRGCIGTILATKKNIAQEIIDNAISACSRDYRFSPIVKDELDNLDISVDVLGEPESIEGISSLDPKKYGVIVKSEDGRTGLLLPNLPGIDDPEYQIAIARQKAGILPNEPIYLYRFEVIRHKD